jgi:hypothetical protein
MLLTQQATTRLRYFKGGSSYTAQKVSTQTWPGSTDCALDPDAPDTFGTASVQFIWCHTRHFQHALGPMNDEDTKPSAGLTPAKDKAQLPDKLPPSKPTSHTLENLTTRVLNFLSTASTETIGGIAVGLAACTYLVLGRVGLVLIGALGGVVLHAAWEGQSSPSGKAEDVRREKGLDIVKRILDLRENVTKDEDRDQEDVIVGNSFEGLPPETATALNEVVDAVIRDYVKWWYHPIIPKDQTFPAASRQTLTKFVLSISVHLSRKRPADMFLDFVANSSSIVIVFLNELASAFSVPQSSSLPVAEVIHKYLAANPESNLANVLNPKQQTKKFKMIAGDILQNFLEKSAQDCDPARIFLREIFAGVVLEMTLKSCSRPEWINEWIVYLLEEGEPDISQAIDAAVSNGPEFANAFDVIDGNVGNIGVAKPSKSKAASQEAKRHKKRLSKAEEAMEEAIEEAKRLSQLIAEEDAKKLQKENRASLEISKSPAATSEKDPLSSGSKSPDLPNIALAQQPNGQLSERKLSPLVTEIVETKSPPIPSPPTPPPATAPPTSFDQILPQSNHMPPLEEEPQSTPTSVPASAPSPKKPPVLTLHNANIIIHDDSTPVEKGKIRSKPIGDYLVQIEPPSSQHPGWMVLRRYADFETLHEVLRRIAQISGVTAFAEQHSILPNWREHTKASLRGELERYLRDACWYQPLAESEGMKRFLDKDQAQSYAANEKVGFPGLGWPTPSAFENMGKGMLDVLAGAPKGVAGGGKAIGGGISTVFTNIGSLGQKKPNGTPTNVPMHHAGRASTSILPIIDSTGPPLSGTRKARASEDSLRVSPIVQQQPSKIAPMERRPSWNSITEDNQEQEPRVSSERSSTRGQRSANQSRDPSSAPSRRGTPLSSPSQSDLCEIPLPPPPSEMPDDYGSNTNGSISTHTRVDSSTPTTRTSISTTPSQQSPSRPSLSSSRRPSLPVSQISFRKSRRDWAPLSEPETRVAVELLFAVINELYTLSSAWNIRRTLLTAAKTFLLRPGNPSLSSIQSLIQDSVIADNTSDATIAANIRKLRENTLPTEEELKAWPPEMTTEEKERLRVKARKLLIERGVPPALTGVMGQAATGEAMQRIFDALQVEEVSRGLVFGLLLQAVRAVTQ